MKNFTKYWKQGQINRRTNSSFNKRTSTLSDGKEVGFLLVGSFHPVFIVEHRQFIYDKDKRGVDVAVIINLYPKKSDRAKIINGAKKFCRYYEGLPDGHH